MGFLVKFTEKVIVFGLVFHDHKVYHIFLDGFEAIVCFLVIIAT